jgi:putative protease
MAKKRTRGSKPRRAAGRKAAKKAPKKMKRPVRKKPAKRKPAKKKPARRKIPKARKAKVAKKKVTAKRPASMAVRRKPTPKPRLPEPMAPPTAYVPAPNETAVGKVTHYYSHLQVAVVELDRGALQVGDTIHVKGHTTDFQQAVQSMEIEHERIERAEPRDIFGLKVVDHAREHDVIYKVQT